MSAPNAISPLMCSSIGLEPILHPPGNGTWASPNLVNRAPIQKKLALNPLTSSYGRSLIEIFFGSICSDYFFVSNEIFDELYEAGNFIETAEVHDYKYGTSKEFIDNNINQGINVFLEIDVQGFQKLRSKNVEFRSMFILPPSIDELRERIQKRGLDSEGVIEKRMKNALKELGEAEEYDYLVINDVFEHAIEELHKMVINKGFKDHKHD